jgi:hypothetical protein
MIVEARMMADLQMTVLNQPQATTVSDELRIDEIALTTGR